MTNQISFMSANFVAREVDYHMTDWGQADAATNAWFEPLDTYAERFGVLVASIRAMGFEAIDIWTAHLNPRWATDAHIQAARQVLDAYGVRPVSLAGGFGRTPAELEASCRLAQAIGVTILGGNTPLLASDRAATLRVLREHSVTLGIENHPEKTPEEVLAKIGDDSDVVAAALDTGCFATEGYDPAQALDALSSHLVHVHLRDVPAPHVEDSCRLGEGCVPFEQCVAVLKRVGYSGPISIEHNPPMHDPTDDCIASLAYVRGLLQQI